MADFRVHVCNAFTGARVDGFEVSAFSWEQLLSARGNGSVTVPVTDAQPASFLRPYLVPWQYIIVLERDGVVKYAGYVTSPAYKRGGSSLTVTLGDLWALLGRRIMTAPGVTNIEKWSYWIENQPRAGHAATLIAWNRDRGVTPSSTFPLTIPGGWTGGLVTRPYYGYEMAYVTDKLTALMDEGLDIWFEPKWISVGQFGWVMHAGDSWGSGTVRDLNVTAPLSPVSGFSETVDGVRVTNNADRVGEGSEVDMLVRSYPNLSSQLPLLEVITMSKTVSDPAQLTALAQQDLVTYGEPTVQWDFSLVGEDVQVGDTARLTFADDVWIPDGIYNRRVVKVSGNMTEQISVSVQPTGGA